MSFYCENCEERGEAAEAEIERLRAQVARLTRMLDDPGTTHADGCASWGPKHYACALARLEAWERASQEGHPDPCTHGDCTESAWGCPECVREMRAEIITLHERISSLESREVCAVAHDHVETCGYCQRDALLARVEAAEHDLMDGAMLIRRLSRQLAKAVPGALAPRNAMDWLTRRPWFKASPLRDDAAMEGGK